MRKANDQPSKTGRGGTIPPVASQFKKGASGNPGGRPKGGSVRDALRSLSGEPFAKVARATGDETGAYAVARTLLETAIVGRMGESSVRAAGLVIDNVDGPPKQGLELSGGLTSFVVEVPPKLTPEEWTAKYGGRR